MLVEYIYTSIAETMSMKIKHYILICIPFFYNYLFTSSEFPSKQSNLINCTKSVIYQ